MAYSFLSKNNNNSKTNNMTSKKNGTSSGQKDMASKNSGRTASNRAASNGAASNRTASNRAASNGAASNRAASNRAASNRMCRENPTKMKTNAYILYMIIGSYFRKCTCTSVITEHNLFLYYKEMPSGKQITAEEEIISYLESYLKKEIGDDLSMLEDLRCEVTITRYPCCYELHFYTGFEGFVAVVDKTGKYTVEWRTAEQEAT